jgi:hypothetical protein
MPKEKGFEELDKIVQAVTQSKTKTEGDWEDGSTIEADGKTWYRYHVDGEQLTLRKPLDQMTEDDWMRTPISLSSVQTSRIPQELTVKFRDPQWAARWFNKSAKDGVRLNQARYMGFVPAKRDDLEWVFNSSGISDADGAVEQGDLVLFKIHKAKLAVMLQKNFAEAAGRGTPQSYLSKTESSVMVPDNHRTHVNFNLTEHALTEKQGVGPVVPL